MQSTRIARLLTGLFGFFALLIIFPDTGYTAITGNVENQVHLTNPFTAAPDSEVKKSTEPVQDQGWLGKAQEGISEREYHASRNSRGLQAPNRAHNLRTYFDERGIGVEERTASDSQELLRLTYSHIGRDKPVSEARSDKSTIKEQKSEITHSDNRVEIRREGITEWFVNSPNWALSTALPYRRDRTETVSSG